MTMTTSPEERTPAQIAAGMVGPNQQAALDEFLADLEQRNAAESQAAPAQAQPDSEEKSQLLAGKFKSAEELERAYSELERKLGQREQQREEPRPEPLTREQAVGHYGEPIVAAAEEAGIDLSAWDRAVKAGSDTKELREKLAAQIGIPAQLIERYEAGFRPQDPPAAKEGQGFTDAQASELMAVVGGEQEFQRLSRWAQANMSKDELADYNAAVDSGNAVAVRLALRAIQARSAVAAPRGEPELIGGGGAAQGMVFRTQQEALEAMRATDAKGRNKYRSDPQYRKQYEAALARSNFDA